jgi:hypothetical protein
MAKKKALTKKATTKKAVASKKAAPKPSPATAQKGSPDKGKASSDATPSPSEKRPPTIVVAGWCTVTADRPYLVERILTTAEEWSEYELRKTELDAARKRAEEVLANWLPELQRHPDYESRHIAAVSVGYRRKFGHVVSPLQINIIVNVERKIDLADLSEQGRMIIPTSIQGVPVKVLEGSYRLLSAGAVRDVATGVFTASSGITIPNNPLPFSVPLIGGVPIAPVLHPERFGTLGIVIDETPTSVIGITNFHVVRSGDVVQLGPDFPGGANPTRGVGTVGTRVKFGGPTGGLFGSVDCAAISLSESFTPHAIRGITHDAGGTIPTSPAIPLYYLTGNSFVDSTHSTRPIWKFGGSSGILMKGRILNLNAGVIQIPGSPTNFINNFSVQHMDGNQFVPDGDSGSILAMRTPIKGKDAFVVVGLIYGALKSTDTVGLACHFSDVVKALNLQIPTTRAVTW